MKLVDYAAANASRTFKSIPFNEVDALLFAQIAYYDYRVVEDGISFGEIQNHPNVLKVTGLRNLIGNVDERLFNIIIGSKRYRDVVVKWHVNDMDEKKAQQFSATTFMLPNNIVVIAFRGTDGTIVGWHEDMNMTYMFPIPSQTRAQEYINKVLPRIHSDKVVVVGHSKGGNLAVYASVMASEKHQYQIKAVYNFDGPGFNDAFYDLDAYKNIKDKLYKFIPPQSSIGRMLKDDGGYRVIKSDEKYARQHWAHNWYIEDNHFVYEESPDFFSNTVDYSTDAVILNMTKDERKEAVAIMFEILAKTDCVYMDDIWENRDKIMVLIKEYGALKERRAAVNRFVTELFKPMLKIYANRQYLVAKDMVKEKTDVIVDKVKYTIKNFRNRD